MQNRGGKLPSRKLKIGMGHPHALIFDKNSLLVHSETFLLKWIFHRFTSIEASYQSANTKMQNRGGFFQGSCFLWL